MRSFLMEYLSFSRSDTRVSVVILILLMGSLIFRLLINTFQKDKPFENDLLLAEVLDVINNLQVQEQTVVERTMVPVTEKKVAAFTELKPELFNPNTVEENVLLQMGLPENIVRNLVKYRAAGGKFRNQSDLLKIYGMNDSVLQILFSYIQLDNGVDGSGVEKIETVITKVENPKPVNLNTADSVFLISELRIPPYIANRIIRFRDLLGGYFSDDQLWEVYGMDSSLYRRIFFNAYIDTLNLKKIDLNIADENMLSKHPYIDRQLARDILVYRKISGNPLKPQELMSAGLLTEEEFLRLRYYLY